MINFKALLFSLLNLSGSNTPSMEMPVEVSITVHAVKFLENFAESIKSPEMLLSLECMCVSPLAEQLVEKIKNISPVDEDMSVIPYPDIIKIFQGQLSLNENKLAELYRSVERVLDNEYVKFDPYQCSLGTELQKQIHARVLDELTSIPKLTNKGAGGNVCTKKLLYLSYRVAILSGLFNNNEYVLEAEHMIQLSRMLTCFSCASGIASVENSDDRFSSKGITRAIACLSIEALNLAILFDQKIDTLYYLNNEMEFHYLLHQLKTTNKITKDILTLFVLNDFTNKKESRKINHVFPDLRNCSSQPISWNL